MVSPKNAVQEPAVRLRGRHCALLRHVFLHRTAWLRCQPLTKHPHQPRHIVVRHKIVAQRQACTGMGRVASALVCGRPPARLEAVRPRQQAQQAVVARAVALHCQPPGWAQQPGGPQGGIGGFCTGVLDAGVRSILAQHLGRRISRPGTVSSSGWRAESGRSTSSPGLRPITWTGGCAVWLANPSREARIATTMPCKVPNSSTPRQAVTAQRNSIMRICPILRNSSGWMSPTE